MGKPIDITGKKFGKLTVLGVHHLGKRNTQYWLCKCECGNEFEISTTDFNRREHK